MGKTGVSVNQAFRKHTAHTGNTMNQDSGKLSSPICGAIKAVLDSWGARGGPVARREARSPINFSSRCSPARDFRPQCFIASALFPGLESLLSRKEYPWLVTSQFVPSMRLTSLHPRGQLALSEWMSHRAGTFTMPRERMSTGRWKGGPQAPARAPEPGRAAAPSPSPPWQTPRSSPQRQGPSATPLST